jgi:hypothetical protein
MSYVFPHDEAYQSAELERQIKRLHRVVDNAVVDNKHLVLVLISTSWHKGWAKWALESAP